MNSIIEVNALVANFPAMPLIYSAAVLQLLYLTLCTIWLPAMNPIMKMKIRIRYERIRNEYIRISQKQHDEDESREKSA